MKYRTKLTLLIIALTVCTAGLLTASSYFFAKKMLEDQIQSQVLSIAATAASQIDGDLHRQIKTRADEAKSPYKTIESQLRKVRDANRRDRVHIKFVYTMVPSDQAESGAIYIVDAEEAGTGDKSHVGDAFEPQTDDFQRLDIESFQIDPVIHDDFGVWVSANAPIRDARGNAVAALGVDLSIDQMIEKTNTLLIRCVLATLFALGVAVVVSVYLSKRVARPVEVLSHTVREIGNGNLDARVNLKTYDEFDQLGQAVNRMAVAITESKTLRGALARYLSHQVAEDIVRSGVMPTLRGESKKVTVLFLDIRDFLNMTSPMKPEDVVGLLNEFFDSMVEIVFKHKGTLDKFLGDGLMVMFGAPLEDAEQEHNAVCAAMEMYEQAKKLDRKWRSQGLRGLHIGIGINTGVAVVGNIGSTQRMDYTAIGNTVNLASRLETATKKFNHDVLMAQTTYEVVKGQFPAERVGEVLGGDGKPAMIVYALQGTARAAKDAAASDIASGPDAA